jgi:hypothetical protein
MAKDRKGWGTQKSLPLEVFRVTFTASTALCAYLSQPDHEILQWYLYQIFVKELFEGREHLFPNPVNNFGDGIQSLVLGK